LLILLLYQEKPKMQAAFHQEPADFS